MIRFPYTVFVGRTKKWSFSVKRYNLWLSSDTTTPYTIIRFGPLEFFSRPHFPRGGLVLMSWVGVIGFYVFCTACLVFALTCSMRD